MKTCLVNWLRSVVPSSGDLSMIVENNELFGGFEMVCVSIMNIMFWGRDWGESDV